MFKPLIAIIFFLLPLIAVAEEFVEGRDYEILSSSSESSPSNSKVQAIEFFSYGCPWCYRIESSLTAWVQKQGSTIQFSRVPVVFKQSWVNYAKAYYTAQHLGLDAKLSPLLFKEIQSKREGEALKSTQEMIDFFKAQGVDPVIAKSAFENSTTIDMAVTEGSALMARFKVNGVPAMVINNQYKTDLQMAKGEARFFQILDYLVAKSAKKTQ
ncbi:MAG: thiol:disulfide interchange protein DsbA/DsbL [Tatlockia sp.]|nr:thiol:disulfide interchange protein DsbA/DsbL [Tatlockia sp.]